MKIRTILLTMFLLLISLYSYGQIKFENNSLLLLQSFPYTTTYDKVIQQLESSKIKIETLQNDDKTQNLSFTIGKKISINIRYTKDRKFIYANISDGNEDIEARLNETLIDFQEVRKSLEKNQFIENRMELKNANILSPSVYTYSKSDYLYQFIVVRQKNSQDVTVYIFDKSFGDFKQFKNDF